MHAETRNEREREGGGGERNLKENKDSLNEKNTEREKDVFCFTPHPHTQLGLRSLPSPSDLTASVLASVRPRPRPHALPSSASPLAALPTPHTTGHRSPLTPSYLQSKERRKEGRRGRNGSATVSSPSTWMSILHSGCILSKRRLK